MFQSKSSIKYKIFSHVKFEFICDNCGERNGTFDSELFNVVNIQIQSGTRFDIDIEIDYSKHDKFLQKCIQDIIDLRTKINSLIDDLIEGKTILHDVVIIQRFNDLFDLCKVCEKCNCKQSWYPIQIRKGKSQKHNEKLNVDAQNIQLYVKWSDPNAKMMDGLPDSEYINEVDLPVFQYTKWLIIKHDVCREQLGEWIVREKQHQNLLTIVDVEDFGDGRFSVSQEDFMGSPLTHLLKSHISEQDFQDYMLQIFDGIAFLHEQSPSISHNTLVAKNILINSEKQLKLTGFDNVVAPGTPTVDLVAIGALMQCFDEKYINKYKGIIDHSLAGGYETIEEIKLDFFEIIRGTKINIYGIILTAIIIFIVVSRLVMRFIN